jgi:integrase
MSEIDGPRAARRAHVNAPIDGSGSALLVVRDSHGTVTALQPRRLPLPTLPRRLRPLPRRAARERQKRPRNGGLGRRINTDGHIPGRWFAQHIWTPAVTAAGLDFHVRVHDLRHADASWLLAGGADIQVVKERLGHGSLRTIEKYLHTLPDADEIALDALRRTRTRTTR